MHFYHGSPIGGLDELKPFLSEHGKPYIYFSSSPIVALLYAVKPVPNFTPTALKKTVLWFIRNILKVLFSFIQWKSRLFI